MIWETLVITYKTARRIVVTVVGVTVVLVGMALLVLPGPAFVVIPIGLAILSIEFAWARRWLRRLREGSESAIETLRRLNGRNSGAPKEDPEA
jgi:tellurite resistance protein TerC